MPSSKDLGKAALTDLVEETNTPDALAQPPPSPPALSTE